MSAQPQDSGHGRDLRLLMVEDNPGDAALLRETLNRALEEGFELVHAETLADACYRLTKTGASCTLLDLSLPDAEGLEGLTRMQTVAPDIPIVVLTGHDDERLALSALQNGAQDYLIKGSVDDRLITRSIRYAIERKRADAQLAYQALHDPLTGLPNRMLFLDRLGQALVRSQRRRSRVAVFFLDLDRFKVINDSLGHEAGDRLLLVVADRLRGALRPSDTVARFGGDEFTILCDDIGIGERDVVQIAERVADAVQAPVLLDETEARVTASLGISIGHGSDTPPEGLIRDADAAMYRAKERGRSRYELFDKAMRARAVGRLELENALYRAMERDEFRLYYQPTVALGTGRVIGLEALIRWHHPVRGLVTPCEFISLAEETGLIVPLGAWVVHEACRQWRRWQTADAIAEPPRVSVNLSARQLTQPDIVDTVAAALAETGTDPARLCLEITESVLLEDTAAALSLLTALKSHGVSVGLDDFGTGYASLSLLKQLPVDLLKVDRSFVVGLGVQPEDQPIVSAVVGLANTLGLTAIAEGVETSAQVSELRDMGCRYAQGFYFARPQPADRLPALLGARLDTVRPFVRSLAAAAPLLATRSD